MAKNKTQGTVVEVASAAGAANYAAVSTWVVIANVDSATNPSATADEIEVTDFASSAKEFLAGLQDFGTAAITGFYDDADAGQTALFTMAAAGEIRFFRITRAGGSLRRMHFQGFVSATPSVEGAPNSVQKFSASLRCTGPVTRVSGTT